MSRHRRMLGCDLGRVVCRMQLIIVACPSVCVPVWLMLGLGEVRAPLMNEKRNTPGQRLGSGSWGWGWGRCRGQGGGHTARISHLTRVIRSV